MVVGEIEVPQHREARPARPDERYGPAGVWVYAYVLVCRPAVYVSNRSICLSIYLFIYLSIYPSIDLSIDLSIYQSIYIYRCRYRCMQDLLRSEL